MIFFRVLGVCTGICCSYGCEGSVEPNPRKVAIVTGTQSTGSVSEACTDAVALKPMSRNQAAKIAADGLYLHKAPGSTIWSCKRPKTNVLLQHPVGSHAFVC
eukprot:6465277-Amphidinium_carterae.3